MSHLVTVHRALSVPEALVATAMLEAAGLAAQAQGREHAQMYWPLLVALGGIGITVPASEAEAALDLLRSPVEPDEGDSEPLEHRLFARHPLSNAVVAAAMFLLTGMPFPAWLARWKEA
ncbi:MAG: hypothetical protein AB7E80_11555 [Hyphomicrobiaceae bacterium]